MYCGMRKVKDKESEMGKDKNDDDDIHGEELKYKIYSSTNPSILFE